MNRIFNCLDAATPSYPDLRNEYDRTLMELSKDKAREAEELLMRLTRQFNELTKTKDKNVKDHILNELGMAIPIMKASESYLTAEAMRTDLDLVEKYIFEAAADNVALLIKQLTALEVKVKAFSA